MPSGHEARHAARLASYIFYIARSSCSSPRAALCARCRQLPEPPRIVKSLHANCTRFSTKRSVIPSAQGREECLKSGDTRLHLYICRSRGRVEYCDSSKHKCATGCRHAGGRPGSRQISTGNRTKKARVKTADDTRASRGLIRTARYVETSGAGCLRLFDLHPDIYRKELS
jgi:hypothetical protein